MKILINDGGCEIPLFTEKRNEVQRIVDARVLFGDQYTINRVGSVDAVYALIEEDLKEAIPNLATSRSSTEVYKITKSTAQALLGKVYLYHKKYADAWPDKQKDLIPLIEKLFEVYGKKGHFTWDVLPRWQPKQNKIHDKKAA